MPYKVVLDCSPAYELLVSMYLYVHPVRGTDLAGTWVKEVNRRLSPELAGELEDRRLEVIHRLAILVWQCPDKSSIPGFLNWLESLPAGDFVECMVPWVNEFKEDMGVVKDRIIRLLRQWDEAYFRHLPSKMLTDLERSAHHERERANREPAVPQIERLTNGIYLMDTDVEHTVILLPQLHLAPHTVLDFYDEGLVVLQYPMSKSEMDDGHGTLLRVTKCLADEHRLRILGFLSDGPKTFTDIMHFAKLGKGLVHYHIMQMRLAGLVHVHYRNGRIQDYGLRREQIVGFAERLLRTANGETVANDLS